MPAAVEVWSINHWTMGSPACCFCFMFWVFGHKVCGILAPQPGMEPTASARKVKTQPLDHRGSPYIVYFGVIFTFNLWVSLMKKNSSQICHFPL